MHDASPAPQKMTPTYWRWAAVVLILAPIIVHAWVSDDAFITLRTVDNLVNGHGLRWNITERVQSFTHPLWLFLQVPLFWLCRDPWLTSISVSIVTSFFAFALASRHLRGSSISVIAVAAIPVTLSSALIDYGTSGLETPLTFLLLALFSLIALGPEKPMTAFWLVLTASLGAVNRLDSLLLFLPTLIFMVFPLSRRRVLHMAAGTIPLVLWELTSLFYFGFLFPNTRYAKLPANVSLTWYLDNGWAYLINLIRFDPVSAALIVAGCAAAFTAGVYWWQNRQRSDGVHSTLGIGVLLYCLYIIYIGGDFMQGRFFAPPIFAAMLILWSAAPEKIRLLENWRQPMVAIAIFALLRLLVNNAGWFTAESRIADERIYYSPTTSLNARIAGHDIRQDPRAQEGFALAANAAALALNDPAMHFVSVNPFVGMKGFYAGPEVILIDSLGLADPLLARLGILHPKTWRVGHGLRRVPVGYPEALRNGSVDAMDPMLAQYYDQLRLVISGPLWTSERFRAIFELNFGRFDHLLRDYEGKNPWDFGMAHEK